MPGAMLPVQHAQRQAGACIWSRTCSLEAQQLHIKDESGVGGDDLQNTFAKIDISPFFHGAYDTEHLPIKQFKRSPGSATHPSSSTGTIAVVRRDGQLCPLALGKLCNTLIPAADHFTSSQPAKIEHNCQRSMSSSLCNADDIMVLAQAMRLRKLKS